MAIEHACTRVVSKPWESINLLPRSDTQSDGVAIGKIWFQRDLKAPDVLQKLNQQDAEYEIRQFALARSVDATEVSL